MSRPLAIALADRFGGSVSTMPCRVMQVTPLLVSFDGGATSVPGLKVSGLTYSLGSVNNAIAFLQSPSTPVVLPIG